MTNQEKIRRAKRNLQKLTTDGKEIRDAIDTPIEHRTFKQRMIGQFVKTIRTLRRPKEPSVSTGPKTFRYLRMQIYSRINHVCFPSPCVARVTVNGETEIATLGTPVSLDIWHKVPNAWKPVTLVSQTGGPLLLLEMKPLRTLRYGELYHVRYTNRSQRENTGIAAGFSPKGPLWVCDLSTSDDAIAEFLVIKHYAQLTGV